MPPILVLQRENICDRTVKSKGFVRTQGFILLDKSSLERTNKHNHIFIKQNWILLTFLTTREEKAFGVSWMCTEKCRMCPSRDETSEGALTWSQEAEPEPRDSYKSFGHGLQGCFVATEQLCWVDTSTLDSPRKKQRNRTGVPKFT